MPSTNFSRLALFGLLAGVANLPGAQCFVPQRLAVARGEFAMDVKENVVLIALESLADI
jgi:hypothetical protein